MVAAGDLVAVVSAGALTAVATGLGAIPVFAFRGPGPATRSLLGGCAIGAMAAASVAGLLLPALRDGSTGAVTAAAAAGAAFVLLVRSRLGKHESPPGARNRRSLLVFVVLLVHSLPEGLAVGAAWASHTQGLAAFVVVGIAVQNIPEGTAVALPMAAAGYSPARQFWAAVLSSAPQPFGAGLAFIVVEQAQSVLPVSLAFAAGAMLAVVWSELLPAAWHGDRLVAVAGTVVSAAAMVGLSLALGV